VLYNLACSYALTKRLDQAATALVRALDQGYSDIRWLLKDPDLENLREHALFKQIKARLRARKVKIQ